jgi:hypothetical protein
MWVLLVWSVLAVGLSLVLGRMLWTADQQELGHDGEMQGESAPEERPHAS